VNRASKSIALKECYVVEKKNCNCWKTSCSVAEESKANVLIRNKGKCPICEQEVEFYSDHEWFRDHYQCSRCHSIPRERALIVALEMFYPNWRSLNVHESSPSGRGVSLKLKNECPGYVASHFYPDFPLGAKHPDGFWCENLENLTLRDESLDLFITQDVMEHVLNPSVAFREIARTLKRGGAHICTVPMVNKSRPSHLRAKTGDQGAIVYLSEPQYHGNPFDPQGSLVCTDWGYDICDFIFKASDLYTTMVYIDDLQGYKGGVHRSPGFEEILDSLSTSGCLRGASTILTYKRVS
jgi:SAM-dependent methyltransferase